MVRGDGMEIFYDGLMAFLAAVGIASLLEHFLLWLFDGRRGERSRKQRENDTQNIAPAEENAGHYDTGETAWESAARWRVPYKT